MIWTKTHRIVNRLDSSLEAIESVARRLENELMTTLTEILDQSIEETGGSPYQSVLIDLTVGVSNSMLPISSLPDDNLSVPP